MPAWPIRMHVMPKYMHGEEYLCMPYLEKCTPKDRNACVRPAHASKFLLGDILRLPTLKLCMPCHENARLKPHISRQGFLKDFHSQLNIHCGQKGYSW